MFCFNHASVFYMSNNIVKMLMNTKFKAQSLTGNPTGNYRCQIVASRALNMSCSFSQSARSIESRCVVMWTNGCMLLPESESERSTAHTKRLWSDCNQHMIKKNTTRGSVPDHVDNTYKGNGAHGGMEITTWYITSRGCGVVGWVGVGCGIRKYNASKDKKCDISWYCCNLLTLGNKVIDIMLWYMFRIPVSGLIRNNPDPRNSFNKKDQSCDPVLGSIIFHH